MKDLQKVPVENHEKAGLSRRAFIASMSLAGAGLAASSISCGTSKNQSSAHSGHSELGHIPSSERRKLGKLVVSSIGMGVQNTSRKYETSTPYRPEMVDLIRSAYDHGVTFFDAAEAYGPHEVERILGEAITPFRNDVVITTKFGWNIDQQTGQRRPGLNSKPDHIKLVVDGMLGRLRTDRIDLLYQHRVDPEVPIEDVAGAIKDLMTQGKVLHWDFPRWGSVHYAVHMPLYPSQLFRTSTQCCGAVRKRK